MKPSSSIALVYIMWIPLGEERFEFFLRSYCNHSAGLKHDFVIIFKGEKDKIENLTFYKKKLAENNISYTTLFHSTGLDIDTYLFAATQLLAPYILFVNTNSLFLADNWLKKYADNFTDEKTGIISATASYQSYYSSVFANNKWEWEFNKGFNYNLKKYKLLLKAAFYWRFLFKPFPNPHVRTNAFMMRREVFLKLKKPVITNKFDAYQFESGKNSLTNQLIKMGYDVILIDKNGKTYKMPEWKFSNTFWQGKQENLLVADNQTMMYEQATEDKKKSMTKLAWGN